MNRGVVVTGASTGIGAAIARHLAGRGFRVFGSVRRVEDEAALDLRGYAGTPYESVLDRFRRAALRGAEQAPPPDKVVRAVWRALNARRPPLRVIVTPHGWLDRIPLWIPDRWLDWLIHRFLWRRV